MPEPYFARLRLKLAEQGISARYIDRLVGELEDHAQDALTERRSDRIDRGSDSWLTERFGSDAVIVAQVLARRELRGRLCGFRIALRPLAQHVGSVHAVATGGALWMPTLMRWSASITCGSFVTAALLFAMARSITFAL